MRINGTTENAERRRSSRWGKGRRAAAAAAGRACPGHEALRRPGPSLAQSLICRPSFGDMCFGGARVTCQFVSNQLVCHLACHDCYGACTLLFLKYIFFLNLCLFHFVLPFDLEENDEFFGPSFVVLYCVCLWALSFTSPYRHLLDSLVVFNAIACASCYFFLSLFFYIGRNITQSVFLLHHNSLELFHVLFLKDEQLLLAGLLSSFPLFYVIETHLSAISNVTYGDCIMYPSPLKELAY